MTYNLSYPYDLCYSCLTKGHWKVFTKQQVTKLVETIEKYLYSSLSKVCRIEADNTVEQFLE